MHLLTCPLVMLLAVTSAPSPSAPTKNGAERLGYPADAKLLILHADDLAVAHSVDAATFEALGTGSVSSASIMMPTPWITEVAAYAKAHPDADLGIHLTLTSEWETYRWGSVAPKDKVPSLFDATGSLPNDVPPVAQNAKVPEVEQELRAQIDRAIALGIHPTHVDSHMGALFATPALAVTYIKVAHDYRLPFLALRLPPPSPPMPFEANDIILDAVIIAPPEAPLEKQKDFYLNAIASLKPGLAEMIVHLGRDDAELQAVTVNHASFGSAWRQRDFDIVTSVEFKKVLKDHGVTVVTWRELQKAAQRGR
jgi:predicted glycoside hydrolase/deacetylase ChbG (UPF0249 family)